MEPSPIQNYLDFLWNQFMYDMGVFSQPWIYYWLLIPALGYLAFFFSEVDRIDHTCVAAAIYCCRGLRPGEERKIVVGRWAATYGSILL